MNGECGQTISVSVIIPCYNCEFTINRAVDSVAQQTCLPREIILINDASTDGTKSAIHDLQQEYGDDWIKVLSFDSNQGQSIARNEGSNQARSDYIAFLDADDSWHQKKLEIQYFWMKAHPEVALTGHRITSFNQRDVDPRASENSFVKKISRARMLLSNPFSTPTVMIRTDVSDRFDPDQHYAEDYLLWLRIFFNQGDVYKFEKELAYMYKAAYGQGGLSHNLVAMEKGEIETYSKIFKTKNINRIQYVGLIAFSLAKFVRRIVRIMIVKRLTGEF